MGVVFHQRRRERVFERAAVLDRNMGDGLHSIEVLGEAHWQTRSAEFNNESREEFEHRRRGHLSGGHNDSVLPINSCAGRQDASLRYRPEALSRLS